MQYRSTFGSMLKNGPALLQLREAIETKPTVGWEPHDIRSVVGGSKWLVLIYWWARQYPVSDACEEAQVTAKTAVDVY